MNHSAAKAAAARKPSAFVILPPNAFCDTWEKRPTADVAVGLRLLSEHDFEMIKVTASEAVDQMYGPRNGGYAEAHGEDKIDYGKAAEAWNESFFANTAALGTCDANDVTKPYFPYAETVIAQRLTPAGIKLVWDAIDRNNIAQSPITPELDDADLATLTSRLHRLNGMPGQDARRLRRLLGYVTAELVALDGTPVATLADALADAKAGLESSETDPAPAPVHQSEEAAALAAATGEP